MPTHEHFCFVTSYCCKNPVILILGSLLFCNNYSNILSNSVVPLQSAAHQTAVRLCSPLRTIKSSHKTESIQLMDQPLLLFHCSASSLPVQVTAMVTRLQLWLFNLLFVAQEKTNKQKTKLNSQPGLDFCPHLKLSLSHSLLGKWSLCCFSGLSSTTNFSQNHGLFGRIDMKQFHQM